MEAGSPIQGLTGPQGHLDALRALHAAIPPAEFWSPKNLGQVPQEAVDAFLDAMVDRRPAQRERLARSRELRGLRAVERIVAMGEILRVIPKAGDLRRGMAWAGGLPLEVVWSLFGAYSRDTGVLESSAGLSLGRSPIRWLPAGLAIHGLWANESGLEDLPEDLRVSWRLDLSDSRGIRELPEGLSLKVLFVSGCPLRRLPQRLSFDPAGPDGGRFHMKGCRSVTTLPEGLVLEELAADQSGLERLPGDLVVKGTFYLRGTPLARLSDAEIRAMAPGVTGEISR